MPHADPIHAALDDVVRRGELGAAAALVWRHGRVEHVATAGRRRAEIPLQRDDLFRIASMTKVITSVLALQLLEEGRFALEDPVDRVVPELARPRVLRSPGGASLETEPALRSITFEDLLTHRSGLTYGDFWPGPLAELYADTLGPDIDNPRSPDAWIAALARLPLVAQPGTAFHYGHSTDLLGFVLARLEDAPLADVLERRILRPLGMKDTSFVVPPHARERRVAAWGFDDGGRLVERRTGPGGSFLEERPDGMSFVSAGQGLWSTLDDYLAFARLLVEGGAVDGVHILRPDTVALLRTNRLTEAQRRGATLFGAPLFGTGHGFGLGVATVIDPATASVSLCKGGVGTVGWPGGFGGFWQADPTDGSVLVFLAHSLVELDQLAQGIGLGVYEAAAAFHSAAMTG